MTEWFAHRADYCKANAERGALFMAGLATAPNGFLYRFEDKHYASFNPYKYEWGNDDEYDIITKIQLSAYIIRSITPCGWTIKANNGNGWRFISKETTKQFALPTLDEAMESFKARKRRQLAIYEGRAAQVQMVLRLVDPTRVLALD